MKKFFCDICCKDCTGNALYKLNVMDLRTDKPKMPEHDVCPLCFIKLRSYVENEKSSKTKS